MKVRDASRFDASTLRLVAITDSLHDGVDGLTARAVAAVAGGVTMVQLRLKDESARTLVEVARRLRVALPGVPVVVNGRADVALAAGAAGVHVGAEDLSPAALRRVVPDGFLIGASVEDAAHARLLGDADYLAAGPLFSAAGAPVVPGCPGLEAIVAASRVPVVAVGGITAENAHLVMAAGAAGIAVISAVFGAPDPTPHARALRAVLDASGS
ncbi:MAG: thiamine-phosphate pyrophosphorylase [Gemmatimonadetes bacterium]|jgi:thiamine-phosphate pyrophosphorylase|nr:thiamine-phosphate pyrophosphorylase [Gemmatimonadota bacterium]